MAYTNDTAITAPEIEVGTVDIGDKLEKVETNAFADAISWFWQNFVSGQSLYQDLVEPVSGDFNRIAANGDAWTHTGKMLFNLGSNMELNARKLVGGGHWTGEAAQHFHTSVTFQWLPALLAAQKVCDLIGKGFVLMSEASVKAATEVVRIITRIADLIQKLAVRFFPSPVNVAVNVMSMVWDAAKHGEFPGMADVNAIRALIAQVGRLFDSINAVVAVARKYVDATTGILDLMKTLPKLGDKDVSIADGKQALDDLKAQTDAGKEAYETYVGKPKTDDEGNLVDEDGKVVVDKDGKVVNPDGEVAREKSEHDDVVDQFDKDVAELERLRDQILKRKKS